MFVRKQMILTIFVVAVTLGAETEFQIVSVQLRSAADRAFCILSPRFGDHKGRMALNDNLHVYSLLAYLKVFAF